MFLKLRGFTSGDPIVVNTDRIIRITGMKEHEGSILTMSDGSKIMTAHPMDDILGAFYGVPYMYNRDLTKKTEGDEE